MRSTTPSSSPISGSTCLRRADPQDQAADLELIIKSCEESAEQRLVIAEYDGEPAGAVLLMVSTLSPLNLEPAVHALAPYVAPGFRRRGVGHTLMDAAVIYAEELGIGHVLTAVASSSRLQQPVHGPARARAAGSAADGGDADGARQAHRPAAGQASPGRRPAGGPGARRAPLAAAYPVPWLELG